uniref:EF-hand domain-containing protein n=1 Tax=Echinostoma caproni TaxID=27848 RepID=A0A183BEA3_9TREM
LIFLITPQLIGCIGTPFNRNTVRLMMCMFDRDHSGTIELNEFGQLVDYVQQWRSVFQRFDRDGSGTIDARELQTALRSFGYNLSPNFIRMMVNRFDRTHRGVVAFDDFIHMCVSLQVSAPLSSVILKTIDVFLSHSSEFHLFSAQFGSA